MPASSLLPAICPQLFILIPAGCPVKVPAASSPRPQRMPQLQPISNPWEPGLSDGMALVAGAGAEAEQQVEASLISGRWCNAATSSSVATRFSSWDISVFFNLRICQKKKLFFFLFSRKNPNFGYPLWQKFQYKTDFLKDNLDWPRPRPLTAKKSNEMRFFSFKEI